MVFNTDKYSLSSVTRNREPITHDYYPKGVKTLLRVEAQGDHYVLKTCDARFNEHTYAQVNTAKDARIKVLFE